MVFNPLSFINRIFTGATTEAHTERRLDNLAAPQEMTTESSKSIITPLKHQLEGHEIQFISMLEGKNANDASVLGWWCAFHNLDREKLIKKLKEQGYIAFADYRTSVNKAKVPRLKAFLNIQGLSEKGRKEELVERVIEHSSQDECARYFTEAYWAMTPKAAEIIKLAELKAKEEDDKFLVLIRDGKIEEFKRKVYPNRNEHWGTEDTFCETVEFIMHHCFEGFGLSEEVRRNASSFAARRSVNFNSRGYSKCMEEIIAYLHSTGYDPLALTIPDSLKKYADTKSITHREDVLEVYTIFVINKARQTAELNNFRRLDFKTVSVDSVACDVCGRKQRQKKYGIDEAPSLPVGWGCACTYSL